MSNEFKQHVDELRAELSSIREALNNIQESGMRQKTVLVLMNHYTGIPQNKIKKVMDGLIDLEDYYFGTEE